MSKLAETLSNIMKEIRKKEGASLEDFADKLWISKTLLHSIERGKANPTLETIEQMAKALEVPPLFLLSDDYDGNEFRTAQVLLELVGKLSNLSEENQRDVINAFDLLVKTLSNKD